MFKNLFDLSGKKAIVTGGAGTLGKTIAYALAEYGADIVVFDKNTEYAEDLVNNIRQLGRRANALQIDLTDCTQIVEAVNKVIEMYGVIDILINHAGINIRKPAEEFNESDWNAIIDVNLKGIFFMAQTVGKFMIAQKFGKIVNTASVSSVRGHPNLAIYAASKGGVMQITKVLANEWARYGINVNAIGPGYIETNQTSLLLNDLKNYNKIISKIPLGRLGKPEDLVGACLFLCSKASDYITGQTLFVEGGRLID